MPELTNNESSLLLYLESRAVDDAGIVDTCRMNANDQGTVKRWVSEGFIAYGRIRFHDMEAIQRQMGKGFARPTHWVVLSAAAWEAAAAERRSRAERTHAKRAWSKTDDPERAVVTESEEVING